LRRRQEVWINHVVLVITFSMYRLLILLCRRLNFGTSSQEWGEPIHQHAGVSVWVVDPTVQYENRVSEREQDGHAVPSNLPTL
jgi:hypothetical protein